MVIMSGCGSHLSCLTNVGCWLVTVKMRPESRSNDLKQAGRYLSRSNYRPNMVCLSIIVTKSINHQKEVKVRCHLAKWQVITKLLLQTKYCWPSYYNCWEIDLNVKTFHKIDKVIHPWKSGQISKTLNNEKVKARWHIANWQELTKIVLQTKYGGSRCNNCLEMFVADF